MLKTDCRGTRVGARQPVTVIIQVRNDGVLDQDEYSRGSNK